MDIKLFLLFVILNIINVIIQTVKSLATVKCGKGVASIVNAIAYGLYTVVLVYTMCDLPLYTKALVVAVCNLIGVYVVKALEEIVKKDKMWLVKVTIPEDGKILMKTSLEEEDIPFTYYDLKKYYVFDCYCDTQADTQKVLNLCERFGGKAFATENKLTL